MIYRTPDKQEHPEYTPFARYRAPCGITWIPLQVGDKQVKWFADSNLSEVVSPFETGMLYGCELPPRAIVPYVPKVLYVTPELLNGINEDKSCGVEIRLIA